uniref:Uncharacterized protein n=1 Tax=Kalanchoe fedtschenkoi TaxID=63787 RepID=A0A7N0TCV8_KALFE
MKKLAEKRVPKDASTFDRKKTRMKKSVGTYKIYIFMVPNQVHPDIGISNKLARYNKKPAITSSEILTDVRLLLPSKYQGSSLSTLFRKLSRLSQSSAAP